MEKWVHSKVSVVTISLESRLFGCELDIICLGAVVRATECSSGLCI